MNLLLALVSAVCLHLESGNPHQQIITSEVLNYDIRYWVHVPDGYENENLPVLYVTDGKWYRDQGKILKTSVELIGQQKTRPHIIVLVDAFDPHQNNVNRRNSQFLCNPRYLRFYREELIPKVEREFKALSGKAHRSILGLSFGGLNSMYFMAHGGDLFGQVGIQSPAPHPCPEVYSEIESAADLPTKVFLNTGTVNDKAKESRKLKEILDKKSLELKYFEIAEGHNWNTWKPYLDDVLLFFYPVN